MEPCLDESDRMNEEIAQLVFVDDYRRGLKLGGECGTAFVFPQAPVPLAGPAYGLLCREEPATICAWIEWERTMGRSAPPEIRSLLGRRPAVLHSAQHTQSNLGLCFRTQERREEASTRRANTARDSIPSEWLRVGKHNLAAQQTAGCTSTFAWTGSLSPLS